MESTRPNPRLLTLTRSIATLAAGITLAVTAIAGCAQPNPTATTAPTSSSSSVPPPSLPTPTCGTFRYASGWPTTTAPYPGQYDCILDAFAVGTPASVAERLQTDGFGGHIEIRFYEVTGVGRVRVTVDATGAQPPGGVTVRDCTSLTTPGFGLVVDGCTPA